MANVQDGGVVGDTKRTIGLGTADPPLVLDVPPILLITREAEPTEIWDPNIWRHGVGRGTIGATAAERQSIALLLPASAGAAARLHRFVISSQDANVIDFEIREGPITLFVSPAETAWTDTGRAGDPAATIDSLSRVGVITNSVVRELRRVLANGEVEIDTPYVIHPQTALIINPTVDDRGFAVSFWFEQFKSGSAF